MKHSRNSQQIQGDFQDFEAPAPAEPEYAGEVTMALPPVPMPDPNARRGLAQPAAKRSVLWSVLGILGEVLMTLAAVCALYVVWQMWWTGVQSEHTQVETRQSASWSDPAGGDSSKVAKAQSGDVPVQPTSASDGELIAQVYVPRFGQGWVRNVVEGTDEAELSLHGLGHYPSTQMPGSVGNFAVAGHRNGYGRPLGDVDLLQEGDAIIVRTKDYWYVYKYTTHKIVTPEHSEVIAANPEDLNTPPSKRMITLTTCEPKYTTATHRWISYGELSYWAKVSDGVPQELATSSNSAKVAFSSSNTSQSFVSKLGTLQPIVLWALVATAALLGMQLKLQGLEPNWGVGPQSLMLLVYSDSFLHHLVPLADAAVWVTDLALLMANALAAALFIRSQRRGRLNLWPLLTVGVTMFTFTVDVADNAWMAMLLTALALMGWMLELLLTGGKDREE